MSQSQTVLPGHVAIVIKYRLYNVGFYNIVSKAIFFNSSMNKSEMIPPIYLLFIESLCKKLVET